MNPRIVIGIASCRRPRMLGRCLDSIAALRTPPGTEVEVVVIDNDEDGSARPVCDRRRAAFPLPLHYVQEAVRGISSARNRAIETALQRDAELLAYIDDDEQADPDWLQALYARYRTSTADIVAGPVIPVNEGEALPADPVPAKAIASGAAPRHVAAGNVLFSTRLVRDTGLRFDPYFNLIGGEDFDFFQRARARGATAVWEAGAILFEWVPPERRSTRYQFFRHYSGAINAVLRVRRQRGRLRAWLRFCPKILGKLIGGLLMLPGAVIDHGRARRELIKRSAAALGYCSALCGVIARRYRHIEGD